MLKVLAVCGNGMGTSMIMKMKVSNVLKRLGIEANVDSCSVGEAKSGIGSYDLVLASIHIVKELDAKKTKLVGLLNLLDEKELEEKLKEVGIS